VRSAAALLGYWHNGKPAPSKTPADPFGIAPEISSAVEDDPHEVIIAESRRELVVHPVLVAGNDDEPARSRLRLPSPGRHPERKNTLARKQSALLWDLDQLPSASEQLPAAPTIVRAIARCGVRVRAVTQEGWSTAKTQQWPAVARGSRSHDSIHSTVQPSTLPTVSPRPTRNSPTTRDRSLTVM
jgi:hypothetical protein